jgi:hypothetical protein
MMAIRDQVEQLYRHADEAEALEHLAADSASAGLREQLQAISQWLAARWVLEFGALTAQADDLQLRLSADLRDRLADIQIDPVQQLTYWAERARNLGVGQAVKEIKLVMPPALSGSVGRDTQRAIDKGGSDRCRPAGSSPAHHRGHKIRHPCRRDARGSGCAWGRGRCGTG